MSRRRRELSDSEKSAVVNAMRRSRQGSSGGRGGGSSSGGSSGGGGRGDGGGDGDMSWIGSLIGAVFAAVVFLVAALVKFIVFSFNLSRRHTSFTGRLRRRQFWLSVPVIAAGIWLCYLVLNMSFTGFSLILGPLALIWLWLGLVGGPIVLGMIVRRLHDTDRSAWWLLIIPGVIAVWVLVLLGDSATPPPRITLLEASDKAADLFARADQPDLSEDKKAKLTAEAEDYEYLVMLYTDIRSLEERIQDGDATLARGEGNDALRQEVASLRKTASSYQEEIDRVAVRLAGKPTTVIIFYVIGQMVTAIGLIAMTFLCAIPGTLGDNRYGPVVRQGAAKVHTDPAGEWWVDNM